MNKIPDDLDILYVSTFVKLVTDSYLGNCICQEQADGELDLVPALCVTSNDELWLFTNAISYGGGGSLCGCGAPCKWMFEWEVVRQLPRGAFSLLKSLPEAIRTERERRIATKRATKAFDARARSVAMDFVDELADVAEHAFASGWPFILASL